MRDRLSVVALAAATAALAVVTMAVPTAAALSDSTYARASVTTAAPTLDQLPVPHDQSFGSALYVTNAGEVYLAGYRGAGDGAGGFTDASATPTKVAFPADVRIVDAIGSTNDFDYGNRNTTGFAALDTLGRVWTWGQVWPGGSRGSALIGRGAISPAQAAAPGVVTHTDRGATLPAMVALRRIENQFLALDASGIAWAWGYGGENLPRVDGRGGADAPLPMAANHTTDQLRFGVDCRTGAAALGAVRWHSIWGGPNAAGAVAQNGLIYTWGFDTLTGLDQTRYSLSCPLANEGANRVLFQAYPDLYRTPEGKTYDESMLATEAERHTRYLEIRDAVKDQTLAPCAGTLSGRVDEGTCPVRQLAFSAQSTRILLQDGRLFTWSLPFGDFALGRTPTDATPAHRPAPVQLDGVDARFDRVGDGIGTVVAHTSDGRLYAWGRNNYCQAIGRHQDAGTPCTTEVSGEVISTPRLVHALPLNVTRFSNAACTTWAEASDGAIYVWGGGRISGSGFISCTDNGDVGAKIFDFTSATPLAPFAAPVTARAVGTRQIGHTS